ncbi:Rieske 2Fe-2S domain-containing protein [Cyanobium sp. ATX 6F1]|uniref:aromatic ring-hydroxylating dioxygenase subunit alpha n=1 Tax=Cyanobium sp. ATX 6F1 TaxID=2823702 RepID=UPI0020CC5082|nr:Rieske 2Fe-2S domain-containing protein [Cyanobium sp. ATX 6F1]MCP9916183.1 Rieske 2Fe-2S domain-containing protein [Cyanobium sp. ATX 6F1]
MGADQLWRRSWYPVAFSKDLEPDRPTAFTLLGDDLVLWFDRQASPEAPAGQWRAFADVCPHRLVPLSQGRLNDRGELECPYHGWSFNGQGHCTAIPQADPGISLDTPRSRCRPYATALGQGLLFVFAGDPAEAASVPLPLLPWLEEDPGSWTVQDSFRDLPYDALTLLENVLDVSHVPFTHHATVGKRESAGPVALELTSSGPEGFTGVWPEGPRQGSLGSQSTVFTGPCLMVHDLQGKGALRFQTVVYATPIRRGQCRLLVRLPFRFGSPWPGRLINLRPEWLQHLANHVVLEDDQLFLHAQERVLEERGGGKALVRACHLATRADTYVRALHDWVSAVGGGPFGEAPLPERLGQTPLLERYESHTRHCRSCRGADRRLAQLRPIAAVIGLLALLGAAWWGPGSAALASLAVALVAGLIWLQAGRWRQQLRAGHPLPPRNR